MLKVKIFGPIRTVVCMGPKITMVMGYGFFDGKLLTELHAPLTILPDGER